jgi:hypothetical protein
MSWEDRRDFILDPKLQGIEPRVWADIFLAHWKDGKNVRQCVQNASHTIRALRRSSLEYDLDHEDGFYREDLIMAIVAIRPDLAGSIAESQREIGGSK